MGYLKVISKKLWWGIESDVPLFLTTYKREKKWLGWKDSNLRVHGPKPCDLTTCQHPNKA